MKKYALEFVKRGLIFGGFGPIICGIVYCVLQNSIKDFSLNGFQVFLAIVSTYLLAFLQAGASIFNQIESFSIPKSILCHLSTIYIAYLTCYLINSWIPFDLLVVAIFTAIFIATYFIIWLSIYLSIRVTSNNLNKKLQTN